MLEDKYCILSFPKKGKHYVLRTSESSDSILLMIDDIKINASMISIADSFQEAEQVFNNIKG